MSDAKYRIMVVAAKKDNNKSLYKYLLDGDKIYEATTLDEIDAKIEKMLNEEGYAKNNLVVINELEFNVFANVVNNTELRVDEPENGGNNGENSGENSGEPTDPNDPNVPSNPEPSDPNPSDPNPSDPEPEPEPSDPGQNDPEPDPDLSDPDTGNP